jgi:hypothetical protein
VSLPAEKGRRFLEPDGTETAVFARHDAVEIFHGRKVITAISITPVVAFKLSMFLVRWWVWTCWAGLRVRIWRWRTGRRKGARGVAQHVGHQARIVR